MLPVLWKSFTGAKVLVFHKESKNFSGNTELSSIKMEKKKPAEEEILPKEDRRAKMKKINRILQSEAEEEKKLAERMR